jgi:hypothetical protein
MSRVSQGLKGDGASAAAIADLAVTYTTDNPNITSNGTIAIADGDAVAGVAEVAEEVKTKINAILAALRSAGIIQS